MEYQDTSAQKILKVFAMALAAACGLALLVVLVHAAQMGVSLLFNSSELSTRKLVETILDGFVLIELFRSFVDYIESHRLHLSLLLETALVFVLREMASGLYMGNVHFWTMVGYAILIPALLLSRKVSCFRECD